MHPAEHLDRDALREWQGRRLSRLLSDLYGRNAFYTDKLDQAEIRLDMLALPAELTRLAADDEGRVGGGSGRQSPWGTALTEPLASYTRYCQTSSTTGRPLRWIDTNESWQWTLDCWKVVYRAARVAPGDRVFFPFSFGPFLGFWAGFEAACQMGLHVVPGGGMSSHMRLGLIDSVGATVVCCTPTYALRLAEVASADRGRRPLTESRVRVLIVAGEPGGSIPATRARIEQSWGARVIDHHGLTEVGPLSFECWEAPGFLHVNEGEYICEVLDPLTGAEAPYGQPGELVVTNLGRTASPVIRYRTSDVVVKYARAVSMRPHVAAARGRHPRAGRRHGQRPRRQRVSGKHRSRRPPLRRRRGIPIDRVAIGRDADAAARDRSGAGRSRPAGASLGRGRRAS